ncbi:hypothetical protein CPL00134L_CDS0033 [Escherichia phage Phagiculus]
MFPLNDVYSYLRKDIDIYRGSGGILSTLCTAIHSQQWRGSHGLKRKNMQCLFFFTAIDTYISPLYYGCNLTRGERHEQYNFG